MPMVKVLFKAEKKQINPTGKFFRVYDGKYLTHNDLWGYDESDVKEWLNNKGISFTKVEALI